MPGYRTLSLGDTRTVSYDTGADWLPLRADLGVGAFGLNAWRAGKGQEVIERHDELDPSGGGVDQEVYVVLEGAARFTVGGDDIPAPAGTVVFVEDPALERVAIAEEDGTLVLAIGAERGKAFEPSAWERRELASRG
jgi:hypothetical protein